MDTRGQVIDIVAFLASFSVVYRWSVAVIGLHRCAAGSRTDFPGSGTMSICHRGLCRKRPSTGDGEALKGTVSPF